MKTLVLANAKGGVTKSTTATILAHHISRQRLRVLAIDLDAQGHLTNPLRRSGKPLVSATTADKVLTEPDVNVEDASFVLLPASRALIDLERRPGEHNAFANNMHHFLGRMADRFDFAIIDTNPFPDIRLVSALVSADFVLSPVLLAQEAIEGIGELLNRDRTGIEVIRARLNPRLRLLGILPSVVTGTALEKANFAQLLEVPQLRQLLFSVDGAPLSGKNCAFMPKRDHIKDAQASGTFLADGSKAWRETWREVRPVFDRIVAMMQEAA
jgi:chromosome partitioning protein